MCAEIAIRRAMQVPGEDSAEQYVVIVKPLAARALHHHAVAVLFLFLALCIAWNTEALVLCSLVPKERHRLVRVKQRANYLWPGFIFRHFCSWLRARVA